MTSSEVRLAHIEEYVNELNLLAGVIYCKHNNVDSDYDLMREIIHCDNVDAVEAMAEAQRQFRATYDLLEQVERHLVTHIMEVTYTSAEDLISGLTSTSD